MKIFVFLTFLAIFWVTSESVKIKCEYHDYGMTMVNDLGYTCKVHNSDLVSSRDDREITGVEGQHLSGKTDVDVVAFYASYNKAYYFPRGLTRYFKNIKYLLLENSFLRRITKKDFKEFHNQLELIKLSTNKITYIENGTLDGFDKLETLILSSNPCTTHDDKAINDPLKVIELIRKVYADCKDPNFNSVNITKLTTTLESKTTKLEPEKDSKNIFGFLTAITGLFWW